MLGRSRGTHAQDGNRAGDTAEPASAEDGSLDARLMEMELDLDTMLMVSLRRPNRICGFALHNPPGRRQSLRST
jgi:hypothetical protein